jgi:aarF domain-containing kinase
LFFTSDFVCDHLRQELDFENEARNGQRTAELIAADKFLSERVHVPRIYSELTTKRVLTTEWIDGVRMSNREAIMQLMGERSHLPRASQPSLADAAADTGDAPINAILNKAPLRGGLKFVMETMVELFGAQIFRWGWVHCDPHPGNFLLRPHPSRPHEPQLVLLDHGLYIQLRPEFRRQYAELWKGLLAADLHTVRRVATEWGIGAPDIFASATLLRPVHMFKKQNKKSVDKDDVPGAGTNASSSSNNMSVGPGDAHGQQSSVRKLTQYELSVKMKERLKSFLTDTDKMPKELVFIGRNMR